MTRRLLLLGLVLAALAPPATAAPAAPKLPAEALLAAGIPWSTVRQVAGPDWWPQIPQFESPPLFQQPLPKRPLAVTSQWFVRLEYGTAIQTTLFAFAGSSEPNVCAGLAELDGVPVNARVPEVGKTHFFWAAGDASAPVSILCFERGPVMVELKVIGETWSPTRLGRLAKAVDANVQALLAGKLSYRVPEATLRTLPPRGGEPGRVLGTAAISFEAWASNATEPAPQQLAAQLRRGAGGPSLGYRRYLLSDGTNVVDVTLFGFRSAAAAHGWYATLGRTSQTASIDLGATGAGKSSLLRQVEETYYVLDFVAGNAVADIACYAPGGEQPSPACVPALKKVAAAWYAQLARG